MKLATLKDSSRDGQLAVVSRDLSTAHFAAGIARTLQQLLDDWNFISPQLEDLYTTLNHGKARHAFPFEPRQCMAPLPRAFQWVGASAYLPHVERVRRARGAEPPATLRDEPLMVQGGSDAFLGPCDDAVFSSAADGIDFEGELAVVTGDLPLGASPETARESVRLLLLANDWTLRERAPAELAKGYGLVQAKPATAFAPVAVTPDELGPAWRAGRAHLQLQVKRNGQGVARLATGPEMHFDFGTLLAHLAQTRQVRAGSIVGGGTVSNADAAAGCACLAELRALEQLADGEPRTLWMAPGETVRLEALADDGSSVFGAIDQRVALV